ncbi:TRAP transporter large permease [Parvibium lacunae]|uniref:C4-dicarboxylate ABC transporter n=1 Tax=Parvibium lacunae TaxID=1888893 RepID=A0A368KZG0_9BURK|nr:TRAP transporter large permease subunit [Parvibium lacunae]RCS56504.1 C4-dicarboxylate ABC transporter [Parvibium lacunae]
MEFIMNNMAPLMFGALFVFLLIGYPIAFSLAALGLAFGWLGLELGMLKIEQFQGLPNRIFGIMSNDNLLAIPFFTLMGFIFDRSGLAEELLETIGQLFGSVRGGIAYAVIFVGAILGGPAGVVAATVISMGLISLPVMLRYGYDRRVASGVITSSGTLAQIIPPSIVLVVVAEQMRVSVGDAYIGALMPSLVLVGLYMGYVFLISMVKPQWVPALPPEARMKKSPEAIVVPFLEHLFFIVLTIAALYAMRAGLLGKGTVFFATLAIGYGWIMVLAKRHDKSNKDMAVARSSGFFFAVTLVGLDISTLGLHDLAKGMGWLGKEATGLQGFGIEVILVSIVAGLLILLQRSLGNAAHARVVTAMMPQILLIFLTLGTIATGLATPTEGGAMGAAGTLVLAILRRKVTWELMRQAVLETTKLTSFVLFVLVGATFFSLTFYMLDGHLWVEHMFEGLPGGRVGFLIVVNLMIFGLAFFLDVFELAFIVIPLLRPVVEKMGIDPVWFTVMLGVNMQTAFMHPPFGFALMYLRSVAPEKEYKDSVTGETIAPVTTAQIYWGAVPFVIIQLLMVGLLIFFPGIVSHDEEVKVDENIQLQVDMPSSLDIPQTTEAPLELNFGSSTPEATSK